MSFDIKIKLAKIKLDVSFSPEALTVPLDR